VALHEDVHVRPPVDYLDPTAHRYLDGLAGCRECGRQEEAHRPGAPDDRQLFERVEEF
jgi:hypothetical protein